MDRDLLTKKHFISDEIIGFAETIKKLLAVQRQIDGLVLRVMKLNLSQVVCLVICCCAHTMN